MESPIANRHLRENNFDFIRQYAALLVIVGHSQILVGAPVSGLWGVSVATLGVQIFLAVSGFLVTDSWIRRPNAIDFLTKRLGRIMPGLALCVLVTVFLLGPALTRLSLDQYFNHQFFFNYFLNIVLFPSYSLAGVFETNTYPNAVNGSLWSLPVEFICYLGVLTAGLLTRRLPIVVLLFGAAINYVAHVALAKSTPIVIYGSLVRESLMIIPFFISGAFFRLINRPKLFTPELAVAAFSALVAVEHFYPAHLWAVTWIIIPYLCVAFGQGSLPVVRRFGRFGDPSYGMYLYAFPVQQTLQFMSGNTMSAPNMIAATTGISVLLGYASWHAVEKHVLDLIKTRSVQPSPDRVREELARQDGEAKAEDHARAVS